MEKERIDKEIRNLISDVVHIESNIERLHSELKHKKELIEYFKQKTDE